MPSATVDQLAANAGIYLPETYFEQLRQEYQSRVIWY